MTEIRRIKKIFKSKPTLEGAGVHLKRAFGTPQAPQFDPFLLLDDFHSDKREDYIQGFPWHPHRGIETITYVLHGDVEHGDSMGNKGVIHSGDVQWMTAGSGIIHQEMPKGEKKGLMWGFQLWANLPASHKMMDPRYRDVKSADIPEVALDGGVKIKIVSGNIDGVQGPVTDIVIEPEYLDVSMPGGAAFTHPVKKGHTALAYTIQGKARFDDCQDPYAYDFEGSGYFDFDRTCDMGKETLILFGDGDELQIETKDEPARFLLISGKPIGEPVAWYGPIVMNTREELRVAFDEYRKGTFIKKRGTDTNDAG